MRVYRSIDNLPNFNKAVITIGTFDGVHTGHARIITQLREEALRINGESVIITFDPHPRKILSEGSREVRLINSIDEKIELIAGLGVDALVIVPFTDEFSKLSADDYISRFLVERFKPDTIIIGYDHRFGQGRKGDYHLLEQLSTVFQYRLVEIPVHVLDAISVSSTRIREAISHADMSTANALLGYDFFFEGTVIHGDQLGRKIGYPTANILVAGNEKLIPGDGVFAVSGFIYGTQDEDDAKYESVPFEGMMSIGIRPTLHESDRRIEVNIFDFNKNIYDRKMRVCVRCFIRQQEKFDGLESLKQQIANDKNDAIRLLAGSQNAR